MTEPVALFAGDRRCRLKWHRARRHAADTAFTPSRIRQGLAAGAAVEVDINPLAGGGWAVLHDATLDRETTGRGPVAAVTGAEIGQLRLRDNDGAPTPHPVATLAALACDLADVAIPRSGHIQLDLKVGRHALSPRHVAAFARDVAPFQDHVILSGGDATAVLRLAEASGIRVGFDPCHETASLELAASGAFDTFVTRACAEMPDAEVIYLARHVVAQAEGGGADLVGAFRARGRQVDVYTFADAGPDALREIDRLLDLGADQITVDDPAAIVAAFAQGGRPGHVR